MAARAAPRRRYHHGTLRDALIDGALALLDEKGADDFSLREVARRIGVTHTAAYRHFHDKDALLAAIAANGFRELSAKLDAVPEKKGRSVNYVCSIARAYVRFALASPSRYQLMFGPQIGGDESRHPELSAAIEDSFTAIEQTLGGGEGDAVPSKKARRNTVRLWAMVHGFCALQIVDRLGIESSDKAETFVDQLLRPVLEALERASSP